MCLNCMLFFKFWWRKECDGVSFLCHTITITCFEGRRLEHSPDVSEHTLFQRGGRIMLNSWPRGSQVQLRCPAVDHDARWNVWRSSTQPHKRTRVFKVKEKRYEFLSSAGYTLDFQVFICYGNYILRVLIDEVSNTLTNLPNYTPVRAPDYLQTDGSVGLIVVCVFTPTDRLNGLLSVAPGR